MEECSLSFLKTRPPYFIGGGAMPEVPIPLINYVHLIKNRKTPYYDIVEFLLKEMEMHYYRTGQGSEVVYTINPRILQEEIEKKMRDEKLTTVNVCRTILAMLYGADLNQERDFYVTTTSSGRRNYHIKVNNRTLTSMARLI
jgi:hypothetical protein